MKRQIIFILLILFILVTGCTRQDNAPLWEFEKIKTSGSWEIYENSRDGYSLKYPPEWAIKRFVEQGFTFTSFVTIEEGEAISVFTTTVSDPRWEMDGPALIDQILRSGENIKILQEGKVDYRTGDPGYRVELLKVEKGLTLKMVLVLVQANDLVYLVGAQAITQYYDKYSVTLDQILASLIIITNEGEYGQ